MLARIHRYTLKQLRQEVEPVAPATYMRFLFHWHGLHEPGAGESSLAKILHQLEGCNLPASCWEHEILARRIKPYIASELDQLCISGKFTWLRLKSLGESNPKAAGKNTPVALIPRDYLDHWRMFAPLPDIGVLELSGNARKVHAAIREWGASFFQDLSGECGLLKTQLEEALGELAAAGLITSDSLSRSTHADHAAKNPASAQQTLPCVRSVCG